MSKDDLAVGRPAGRPAFLQCGYKTVAGREREGRWEGKRGRSWLCTTWREEKLKLCVYPQRVDVIFPHTLVFSVVDMFNL